MAIQFKTRTIIGLILALLLITLGGGWYWGHLQGDRALNSLKSALNDTISHYVVKINNNTVYIAQVEQEILSQREVIKQGEISRKELRTLNLKQASEINRLKFRIDTLLTDVSHNGKIISVLTEKIDSLSNDTIIVKKNAILLPFNFTKTDQWLKLDGTFNNVGKLDISLSLVADVNVYTGWDKTLKSYKSVVTSDSPYLQTIGIKSFKLDLPKVKKYGLSIQTGYGVQFGNPIRVDSILVGDSIIPS
jgi:hypothetical protein